MIHVCPKCRKDRSIRLFPLHCSCGYVASSPFDSASLTWAQRRKWIKRGLGYAVRIFCQTTGIEWVKEKIQPTVPGVKSNCGCDRREDRLNQIRL